MNEIEIIASFGDDIGPMSELARTSARDQLLELAHADRLSVALGVIDSDALPVALRQRRRRRAVRFASVAAAVVAAAGATFALQIPSSSPAYASVTTSHGVVTVHIREFLEPMKLEARLAAVGLPAVVDYVPAGQACQQPRGHAVSSAGVGQQILGLTYRADRSDTSFDFKLSDIKHGQTLVLEASFAADNPKVATSFDLGLVEGPVAACNPGPSRVGPFAPHTQSGPSGTVPSAGAALTSTNS